MKTQRPIYETTDDISKRKIPRIYGASFYLVIISRRPEKQIKIFNE